MGKKKMMVEVSDSYIEAMAKGEIERLKRENKSLKRKLTKLEEKHEKMEEERKMVQEALIFMREFYDRLKYEWDFDDGNERC